MPGWLFMTGGHEPNSTPAMSRRMASLVSDGMALIVEDAAHMMPMTHPSEVNQALRQFAREVPAMSGIEPRELRDAFGRFMTGVTVVTCHG